MSIKKKNAIELAKLIMTEVRQHPEWSDLVDVTIQRIPQYARERPNWDASFTLLSAAAPPEGAFTIIKDLQSKYDVG